MMTTLEIAEVEDAKARERALLIRREVFVGEQRVPERFEFDHLDAGAVHLLASLGDRPVGTLRIRFPSPGSAKIERVAVRLAARGYRVGHRLVAAAMALAYGRGATRALVHAQLQASRFYEGLGFEAFGQPFVEDGIVHVRMHRPLIPDDAA